MPLGCWLGVTHSFQLTNKRCPISASAVRRIVLLPSVSWNTQGLCGEFLFKIRVVFAKACLFTIACTREVYVADYPGGIKQNIVAFFSHIIYIYIYIYFCSTGPKWRPYTTQNQRLFEQYFQQKSFLIAIGKHKYDLWNKFQINMEKHEQNHPYARRPLRRREIAAPPAPPALPAPAPTPLHPLEVRKRQAIAQEDYLLAAKVKLQLQVRALAFCQDVYPKKRSTSRETHSHVGYYRAKSPNQRRFASKDRHTQAGN